MKYLSLTHTNMLFLITLSASPFSAFKLLSWACTVQQECNKYVMNCRFTRYSCTSATINHFTHFRTRESVSHIFWFLHHSEFEGSSSVIKTLFFLMFKASVNWTLKEFVMTGKKQIKVFKWQCNDETFSQITLYLGL